GSSTNAVDGVDGAGAQVSLPRAMPKADSPRAFLANRIRAFQAGSGAVVTQVAAKTLLTARQQGNVIVAGHEETEVLVRADVDHVGIFAAGGAADGPGIGIDVVGGSDRVGVGSHVALPTR